MKKLRLKRFPPCWYRPAPSEAEGWTTFAVKSWQRRIKCFINGSAHLRVNYSFFFSSLLCMCALVCAWYRHPCCFFFAHGFSISAGLYNTLTPHCQTDGAQATVDDVEEENEDEEEGEKVFSEINHTQLFLFWFGRTLLGERRRHSQSNALRADGVPGGH